MPLAALRSIFSFKTERTAGSKLEIPFFVLQSVATVAKPFAVTVDKQDGLKNIRILARYDEPIAAPVRVGDVVGELIAEQNGRVIARAPMIAQNKVRKTILFGRVFKNIKVLLGL